MPNLMEKNCDAPPKLHRRNVMLTWNCSYCSPVGYALLGMKSLRQEHDDKQIIQRQIDRALLQVLGFCKLSGLVCS